MYFFIQRQKNLRVVAGAVAGAVAVAVSLKGPKTNFESQPSYHNHHIITVIS